MAKMDFAMTLWSFTLESWLPACVKLSKSAVVFPGGHCGQGILLAIFATAEVMVHFKQKCRPVHKAGLQIKWLYFIWHCIIALNCSSGSQGQLVLPDDPNKPNFFVRYSMSPNSNSRIVLSLGSKHVHRWIVMAIYVKQLYYETQVKLWNESCTSLAW